jgi:predicted SAM-dependent methyltransferase
MRKLIRRLVPIEWRQHLRDLRKRIIYTGRYINIRLLSKTASSLKIIAGAALTSQAGWLSTNQEWLDVADEEDWKKIFGTKKIITHVVAEHVFEHLTEREVKKALSNFRRFMKPNARIRIAVPDGNNPNKEYLKQVGVAGLGPDAQDHKQLFTAEKLTKALEEFGFHVNVLEGYLSNGELVSLPYDVNDGFIIRSRNNVNASTVEGWDFVDARTSLIVDGIKA